MFDITPGYTQRQRWFGVHVSSIHDFQVFVYLMELYLKKAKNFVNGRQRKENSYDFLDRGSYFNN
jgi:hypothetical protein